MLQLLCLQIIFLFWYFSINIIKLSLKKNVENKKQNTNHYGYNVYEEQFDEFGQPINRNILGKYDEEIDGSKTNNFVIGENLEAERNQKRKLLEVRISKTN